MHKLVLPLIDKLSRDSVKRTYLPPKKIYIPMERDPYVPGDEPTINTIVGGSVKIVKKKRRGSRNSRSKVEPVKEEPVQEEPVQEEPVKEEPIKEEIHIEDPRKGIDYNTLLIIKRNEYLKNGALIYNQLRSQNRTVKKSFFPAPNNKLKNGMVFDCNVDSEKFTREQNIIRCSFGGGYDNKVMTNFNGRSLPIINNILISGNGILKSGDRGGTRNLFQGGHALPFFGGRR